MAADSSNAVRIQGLSEFRRSLNRVDSTLGKQIGAANKRLGDRVVAAARSRYAQAYTVRSGTTQRSLRSSAAQARVQVKLGGARSPWALGQEFGSNRYPQFRPWTGRGPGGRGSQGRFLYPAIRDEMDSIGGEYLKILDSVVREAFPNG